MSPPARRRGLLVALEGIDGAGKSTVARRLLRLWQDRGLRVVLLREPANRRIGERAATVSESDPWRAAVWFTLDRELARPGVETALSENDIVLQDRSYYSTMAYQGSALPRADRARLERLQRAVARAPDLVVLFDIDPGAALGRLERRGTVRAPLERRAVLERVAASYRRLARSGRWFVVPTGPGPSETAEQVDRRVARELARRRGRPGERNLSRRAPARR